MRTKVALTVLILIILPTAILSLTAYRAIRNRELLLESRLKDSAENALRAVFGRISAKIADNMNQVNAAMSECIGRSARYRDIEGTVARLCGSGDLVGQVYLFMNPWGFLYPDPVQAAIESYPSEAIALSAEKKEVLIAALRQEIASAEFPEERLFFTSDEISYCFSPIQGRKDLYTGYEIDSARLRKLISDTITSFSARDFIIVAEGRGLEKKDNLAVGDSFSGVIRRKSSPVLNSGRSPVESYGRKRFIAMGRLPVPLENVILTAVMTDSGEIERQLKINLFFMRGA